MENFLLGFKVLFRIWADADFAAQVRPLLEGHPPAPAAPVVQAPTPAPAPTPPPIVEVIKAPARSDALTLLSVLQREARFVDFIQEPVADYTDAQIGAAVRSVHKDCATVLRRLFALETLRAEPEGKSIEVPAGFDAAAVRLTGNIPQNPPFRGILAHPGWRATRCEVPQWNGREDAAWVVAPAEVEIK